MNIIEKIFGTHSENELKRIYPIVDRIEHWGRRWRHFQTKNFEERQKNLKND